MPTWPEQLSARHRAVHEKLVAATADLDDDLLARRPAPGGPQAIGWQIWHVARWQDRFGRVLARRAPELKGRVSETEVWESQGIAARWGWPAGIALGQADAGTGLDDAASEALPLPGKAALLEYAAAAFAYAEAAVAALDPDTLLNEMPRAEGDTYADIVLGFLEHTSEHVGTILSLRGALGLPGSPE